MLRGTSLSLMVLVVAMVLTPRADAQSVKTVTGGGNPGNPGGGPISFLPPPPPPRSSSGNGGVPNCPLPGDKGASTTFSATYNGKSAACYNVADRIRNCECPDNYKFAACCKGGETCTTDQTTKCNTCCKSPAGK